MRKIISRPRPDEIPALSLPFHVRSVGYHEAPEGWEEDVEGARKNFVQFFWCVGGAGEAVFPEGPLRVEPGDVFHRRPRERHHHRTAPGGAPWRYHWFTFDGPGAEAFMRSYGYPRAMRAGKCPTALFRELEPLLRERTRYAQRHALSLATEILARAGEEPSGESPGGDHVREFISLAHERFDNPQCSVESLAAEMGLHRSTLYRAFRAAMGMSPVTYLNEVRLQRALSLLSETRLPIKEVAQLCGTPNVSYFCRLVRRRTGESPADHRRATLS